MDLVVDTSAVIAVIGNEPRKPALVVATRGARLLAPASLHWEVGNAFSAMRKRGRIDGEQTTHALAAYRAIPIRLLDVDLEAAVTLAAELGVYAYDAYFVAAARTHGCELLTLDGGLAHAAVRAGVAVREVSA